MTFDLVEHIRRHGFKRLLLAVSGGLDSICLAHYFIENSEVLGIEWLGIAHVHHGLREGTADRDAAFVEAFAKSHGVPFFLKKLDGEALKAAEGSLEENARDARYKALVEVVKNIVTLESCKADRVHDKSFMDPIGASPLQDDRSLSSFVFRLSSIIVTAHHAGDQAETMYMRLRRGTTLAGLRGIQALRQAQGPFIYRPFLNVSREELLAYVRENGLEWCEDESNVDVKFARNKIRHVFLPHLEENCPGATQQLCRIAEIADKVYEKVLNRCNTLFSVTVEACKTDRVRGDNSYEDIAESIEAKPLWMTIAKGDSGTLRLRSGQAPAGMTSFIALDKKKLNRILQAHKEADLSELFRLWLSENGFRFPMGFFYAPKEPAHLKIPVRAVYRKRSIVKIRNTVRICEFKDALMASKFVSCEMNEKDYNEST